MAIKLSHPSESGRAPERTRAIVRDGVALRYDTRLSEERLLEILDKLVEKAVADGLITDDGESPNE